MCDGGVVSVPLTMMVIGALTAKQMQKQQQKATEAMAAVQQQQINDQAAQKTNERMEEARKLRAQARASAAEAGVAGNSVDALLDDIYGQAGRDVALIETNRKNGIDASAADAAGRIRMSKAEMWSGVASSAVNSYDSYQRYKITDKS